MKDMSFDFPYPSQRMPVFARNIVATSQPLAAQAGLRILLKGGNAVDAAIATAITLTVVEPTSNGIGADAFAILWDGKKLVGLNGSGKSPAALTPDKFNGLKSMPRFGWKSVTVPGAVSLWAELHRKYGKLPFGDLFEYAIEYASDGYLTSPVTADLWVEINDKFKDYPDVARTYMPKGVPVKTGEKLVLQDHARTLCRIAATKGKAFYEGDLAEKIVAYSKATGGYFTMEDLAEHKPEWVDTVSTEYHGVELHEIPPNGQGIAALMGLGILRNTDIQSHPLDSVESLHIQIEAMKLAFADAWRYVSDPRFMTVKNNELLNKDYLAGRAKLINMDKAGLPVYGIPPKGGTVYLTAADSSGMMVSFIQSNYVNVGSGLIVPGTGIALQNRGSGFVLEEGHPNQVGGRKRPYHTIIPAFVTQKGQPLMSFGVMGGPMQPQGHIQVMSRMFDYGLNPQSASDGPRWRVIGGNEVWMEPGFDQKTIAELEKRGHKIVIARPAEFGGAQLICRMPDGYCAGSDHRKDGQAVGY